MRFLFRQNLYLVFAYVLNATKHGWISVKVRSPHINVDNCRYSHICKSENPDFHQYSQIFGDASQKYEDMQRFAELCGYVCTKKNDFAHAWLQLILTKLQRVTRVGIVFENNLEIGLYNSPNNYNLVAVVTCDSTCALPQAPVTRVRTIDFASA